ncbi:lipopolysaccharide transport system permease protein [Paenibacillus sp. LBL]|uniref:ABC transporter permease n=1 Tax=Paenibacillus sp. LBL TaxID=2940563 RepID=UPI002476537C|nr:ABC transporter permease [Paenibacillus sp. LBL]MDH6674549.1 lipopolysaccharide transport system permease protein [Paenibacillus sp. LBL]
MFNKEEFQKNKNLIKALVKRELKAKYKQSILGKLWIVIQPFLLMIVLSIVFSRIVNISSGIVPYPVFLYTALLPWTLFTNSVGNSAGIFTANASLIKQRPFFRPALVIQRLFNEVINFLFSLLGYIALIVFYQVDLSMHIFFVLPVLLLQIYLMFSFMLIISSVNVYFRDVSLIMPIILRVWFYLSPVIYSKESLGNYYWLYYINPMAPIIEAYRNVVLYKEYPNLNSLIFCFLTATVVFISSIIIFKKIGKNFADVL